jgi:hypothetical protein
MEPYFAHHHGLLFLLILLFLWDLTWRGLALWRAGRRNESGWFVALLLLNTLGLLPIFYLYTISLDKTSKR